MGFGKAPVETARGPIMQKIIQMSTIYLSSDEQEFDEDRWHWELSIVHVERECGERLGG
jgi:hypothetical protein